MKKKTIVLLLMAAALSICACGETTESSSVDSQVPEATEGSLTDSEEGSGNEAAVTATGKSTEQTFAESEPDEWIDSVFIPKIEKDYVAGCDHCSVKYLTSSDGVKYIVASLWGEDSSDYAVSAVIRNNTSWNMTISHLTELVEDAQDCLKDNGYFDIVFVGQIVNGEDESKVILKIADGEIVSDIVSEIKAAEEKVRLKAGDPEKNQNYSVPDDPQWADFISYIERNYGDYDMQTIDQSDGTKYVVVNIHESISHVVADAYSKEENKRKWEEIISNFAAAGKHYQEALNLGDQVLVIRILDSDSSKVFLQVEKGEITFNMLELLKEKFN